jgi:hypothetical protein
MVSQSCIRVQAPRIGEAGWLDVEIGRVAQPAITSGTTSRRRVITVTRNCATTFIAESYPGHPQAGRRYPR